MDKANHATSHPKNFFTSERLVQVLFSLSGPTVSNKNMVAPQRLLLCPMCTWMK